MGGVVAGGVVVGGLIVRGSVAVEVGAEVVDELFVGVLENAATAAVKVWRDGALCLSIASISWQRRM